VFASKSAFKIVYGTTEGAFELAKNSIDAGVLSNITNEPVNNSNIFPIIVATAIISSVTTYAIIKVKEHKKIKTDNENNERSYIYGGI
jgi:hypothetical protein